VRLVILENRKLRKWKNVKWKNGKMEKWKNGN